MIKKTVMIKMVTNDVLKVEMKQDMPNDEIYAELLNGKKEFCLAGGVAIAKEHIVYVMIGEEPYEENGENQTTAEETTSGDDTGAQDHSRPTCESDCSSV